MTTHPFAPTLEHAFTISIELAGLQWVAPTAIGATRAAVYAASGTIEGPRLNGRVIPMSGGDFPLVRPNGVIDFDARYLLEADDGAIIYLQNRGYRWGSEEAMAKMAKNEPVEPHEDYMRVVPKFEAPEGPHEWMNRHVFVGVAEKSPGANRIHYFVVL
ncbi:MAG: DUF3237 domain-containing protein [Pseudolabrys sp.]